MNSSLAANLIVESDTLKGKNLTFTVDNESYGLEIKYVTQIIGMQKITQVPEQPQYIKGVINLRGQIIPVMDIRTKFNKQEIAYDDRTCIIVLVVHEKTIGIIVDRVSEVITIEDSDIAKAPDFNDGVSSRFIRGIGKVGEKVVILIDSCELVEYNKFMASV